MVKAEDIIKVKVDLDKNKYGKGFAEYTKGTYDGYAFYEIVKDVLSLITISIVDKPVITAVTEEQHKSWKNKKIIALPKIITVS